MTAAPRVVALFGATGTGKTALACALADRLPCRLVSCDALQVYRHLDAATAKPEGDERRHPWALVDLVEPTTHITLGDWVRAAQAEVARATAEGKIALVAGGTGMYLRGLLKGVAPAPARDEALRARLRGLAARRGVPFLHRVLARLDPATAARLQPRDSQRLVRALEVWLATGASLSGLQAGGWDGPDLYPALRIGLELPREELNRRLGARVERFFARGLVEEVRELLEARGVPPGVNALAGIGYRETVAWLRRADRPPVATLAAEVERHTRQYAKRQTTWFRRERPVLWADPRDPGLAARLVPVIRAFVESGVPAAPARL